MLSGKGCSGFKSIARVKSSVLPAVDKQELAVLFSDAVFTLISSY